MEERTAEILRRFNDSWIQTEKFYHDLISNYAWFDTLIPITRHIIKLRQQGLNNYFRLGTSMHSLIISRSVNHGLRIDQKYIKIEVIKENDFEVALRDGNKTYRIYRLNNLDDNRVTKLLMTLKSTLVD